MTNPTRNPSPTSSWRAIAVFLLLLTTFATAFGQVVAWGSNDFGGCDVPAGLASQTVTAIAGGYYHSLALTSTGKVVAWGRNDYGQCDVPAGLASQTVTAIAGGGNHSLALTSTGKVVAWGYNGNGVCDVPASLDSQTVTAIAGGGFYSLALTSTGKVVAWGYDGEGQCDVPVSLGGQTVTAIAGGGRHSLALVGSRPAPDFTVSEASGTFTGGRAATVSGTVTFGTAVSSDTTVNLSSSDASATVPDSVLVQAGSTSATFTVTSVPVAALTSVKLTANTSGYAKATNEFTLKPQSCAVSVNPASFEGGTTGSGKVTLNVPFATDTVVTLASSDPLVDFGGATVTVPANQSTANFDIPSTTVVANTNVDITATPGISTLTATKTITLKPVPTLSSFTASRSTVYGNQMTTFTLKLASKPGPSGTTVMLNTTGSGLPVPNTVFFPAGVTSKTIDVYANESAADGSVLVTATSGTAAIGKSITVKPLKLSNSSLSVSSVKGGTPVSVTVTLNAIVDVDTVITVASSDPSAASVPATVKVPAGSNTVTYTLTTYAVTTRKTVTITATKGGYTSTKTLVVNK
jgi:Regulator of chromosome condensation (RCC1) repeat